MTQFVISAPKSESPVNTSPLQNSLNYLYVMPILRYKHCTEELIMPARAHSRRTHQLMVKYHNDNSNRPAE